MHRVFGIQFLVKQEPHAHDVMVEADDSRSEAGNCRKNQIRESTVLCVPCSAITKRSYFSLFLRPGVAGGVPR